MRNIIIVAILFLLCPCYMTAQDQDQPLVSVIIRLQSGTNLETFRDLLPDTQPVLISENQYRLRLRPKDIGFLRWLGIDVLISGGSTKQEVPVTAGLPFLPTSPNPFVQEMVNAVSRESLATVIQDLQAFGTRYEYTPTQDSAAVYLYNEFQRWGLNVAYDSFALGTSSIYDLDYHTTDTGWVCGTGGLIAYTTDGGASWTNNSSGLTSSFYGMDFVSSTTGWVVSDYGTILQSTNGGVTWSSQSSPVSSTLYDVMFEDDQHGLTVGVNGRILHTTDGGGTWTSVASGTSNTLRRISFVDSLHAWVVGGVPGSNGIVLHSTDGGLNWSPQTIPPGSDYFRGVCFIDSLNGWITGDGPAILKTTDGGINWIAKTPPSGTGPILRGVSFINILEGWTVDYYGQLLHTTDGGESWSISYTPPGSAYLVDVLAFSLERITITGTSSTIITSTDGGSSWIFQSENLPGQFFHRTQNVVATIPGSVTPENECVIVAHYDSYSNNPYVSAPGANDNATGTSAVMEAARICRDYEFSSTIKFLAVSAEELGLHGSKHYAAEAQVQGRNIVGVVNGDMLGYPSTSDSARLVIGSYQYYNRLIDSAISYNARYSLGLNLVAVVDNAGASDHAPFAIAGFDALDLAEATTEEIWGGSDPYYHKTTDTFDKLNMGMVTNGARLMITTISEMAQPVSRISGGEPVFSATSTLVSFGNVLLGNSKTDSVTISNTGTDTLVVQTVSSDAPEFYVLLAVDTLPPGGAAKFYITFTPSTVGSKTGNGIFIHNASGSPDTINFTGTCSAIPVISILTDAIDFGEVEVGNSREDSIHITNTGAGFLIVHSITTDNPDYSISVLHDTIPPGEHRWYTINFEPSGAGLKTSNGIITHNAAGSPDSVELIGTGTTVTVMMTHIMSSGWNMVSPPLAADDMRKTTLFPSAASEAFYYNGAYVAADTLNLNKGCWLKFDSDQSVSITGFEQTDGTVGVDQGWNMIGSPSVPIPVSNITSDPPGLITSQFFGYDDGYIPMDTIKPWGGYWVKVSNPGTLSFSSNPLTRMLQKNTIKIIATDDPPPSPPDGSGAEQTIIPTEFALGQVYPNPFNPSTRIEIAIPVPGNVTMAVYDILGREVTQLMYGHYKAGRYTITWDGGSFSSGVYIARFVFVSESGSINHANSKKLFLAK